MSLARGAASPVVAEHLHPSGTVAFLFTDIEGSTVRWDRAPEAMQRAVRRHDELMREAIGAHRGHVFKTIGDAFCAVFWTIDDGVGAALAAQRLLAAEDFSEVEGVRVRMALHVGDSDERDGDYFGPTLNRVARLLAIGHGGQVLLSSAAAEKVLSRLAPDATLTDLGEHRLKDLSVAERVYQLAAPGIEAEFPSLRSQSLHLTNLPQQISSFVGRDREVAEIEAALELGRLVTLFGTGGLGKTRCSLRVASEVRDAFADGVWFVDFAPLSDSTQVPNAIAAVFGVREASSRPAIESVCGHLKTKSVLLIFDNCEHVVEEASSAVAAILNACPKVKIIATSREALKIPGERLYQIQPLAVPERGGVLSAAQALGFDAVALFDARARSTNARFELTDDVAPFVVDVCRRLDGIPLAIELAAARVKMLSPRQILQKLDERFRMLTGGDRTALPRQQTLRALIDWSYDALSEPERRAFRGLAVFRGSFGLDTAAHVVADESLDEFEALDIVASLVDKSLVLAEPSGHETRYRLLESIREYGIDKLKEVDELASVASRHAVVYADIAERLEHEYESVPYRRWLADTEAEAENVRAALGWSFGPSGDPLVGQRIAATLRRVLIDLAAVEARRWVGIALETVDARTPPAVLARLYLCEATLASTLSQFRAASSSALAALQIFEDLHDVRGAANAKRWNGRSLVYLGKVAEGERLLRESLIALDDLGYKRVGSTLRDLAAARGLQGDVEGARPLFERALANFKSSQDEYNVAVTAGTLAEAEFRCGDVAAAVRTSEEGLAAARELGRETRVVAWILCNLAGFLTAFGHFASARERAREALQLGRDAQVEVDVVFAIQHLAAIAALRPAGAEGSSADDRSLAARLLGFVDGRLVALDVEREYTEQTLYDAALAGLRAAFDASAVARLMDEGRALAEERALAEARAV